MATRFLSKKILSVLFTLLLCPSLALAESKSKDQTDDWADSSDEPERERSSHHEFNHSIEYARTSYKDPGQECVYGGFRGALVGLGTGIAFQLISYGATGKGGDSSGRVTSAAVGLGFIVGAVHGYWSAESNNDRIQKREDRMLQKYGNVEPMIFTGSSLASTGFGLKYTLALR